MEKVSMLPADTYIVVNKTLLNENDRRLITILYQPIIGSISTSLFFTLWGNLDKCEIISQELSHHHLMSDMQISLENIKDAREKLEGIGLLKTYYKKDNINKYIYELYSPVSAFEFFNNPILSVSLETNVGKEEYNKLINYFKIPEIKKDDYTDISCSFSDIFSSIESFSCEERNLKKINNLNIDIPIKIDIDSIISLLPDEMINKNVSKDTKKILYKLIFIYDLDSSSISEIIRNSINEKHVIDVELLKDNCRKFYSFEHIGKLPSLIYKCQPESLRKEITGTTKRDKIIYKFETLSPYDFLYEKSGNTKPILNDLKIVEYLLIDQNLNPGVINVLIDYVLKINNNKLTKAFVLAISSQWVKSGIKTVEQAMIFAEKEYKSRKIVKTNNQVIKKVPSWFDKKIESNEATEEEQREFENKLNSLR